jgi:hypothetical protein
MKMMLRVALATALVTSAVATRAWAGELKLTISNGHVTLIAKDVTVREILAEWARVGQARIVNAEKLTGGPVTLELTDVPEAGALDAILRSAAGYVAAPRTAGAPGASVYDRIMILASSRPPAAPVNSPPPFTSRPMPQVPTALQGAQDDEQELVQPGVVPGANPGPGMMPNVNPTGQPGFLPGQPAFNQNMPVQGMPATQQPQPPMTAPRPGMLPAPVNQAPPAPNPYLGQPPGPASPTFNPMPQQPQQPTRPGPPGGPRGGQPPETRP